MIEGIEVGQEREVVGVDARGRLLVDMGKGKPITPFALKIGYNGHIKAEPVVQDTTPDQINGRPERVPVSERWKQVDQA